MNGAALVLTEGWAAVILSVVSVAFGALSGGVLVFLKLVKASEEKCHNRIIECYGQGGFLEKKVYQSDQATRKAELRTILIHMRYLAIAAGVGDRYDRVATQNGDDST